MDNMDKLVMDKLVRSALLIILLLGSLSFAATTIDSCQNLTSAGETYQLTTNISSSGVGACIGLKADGITLDCQNHQIQGTGDVYSQGIYNEGHDNVTIKNCQISQFGEGIYFKQGADGGEITGNVLQDNEHNGILLEFNCTGNAITDNTASNNGEGVAVMYDGQNNTIQRNTANGNGDSGVYLGGSPNNFIQDNEANGNAFGVYLDFQSDNNQVTGNTADNNQIGFVLSGSSQNQLQNNYARNNEKGVQIEWSSTGNRLTNNDLSSNTWHGVFFQENGSNNELTGNNIINNPVDVRFESGCTGNSGANTCDTIEDVDGSNMLTCSGTGGSGGQTGPGTGNQTGALGNNGGSTEDAKGVFCCPPGIVILVAVFLFRRETS